MAISINPVAPGACRPRGWRRCARSRAAAGKRGQRAGAESARPPIWCGSRSPASRSTWSRKFRCRRARPCSSRYRRPRTASASPWSGRAAMPRRGRRRRHAVARCAGRCGGQSGRPSCAAEERADAAGARGGLDGGADRGHRAGQPGAAVCQSRRGRRVASNLPPKLQQAMAQVLAQQTSLDQNLDGGDIKTAFQKSGLFLEASLASGSVPASGVPDLKAALIVLRQTLQSALGANAAPRQPRRRPRRCAAASRDAEPCAVACRRSRRPGNPAAAGAAAGRRRLRGARQRRSQRACGGAERRTFGRRDAEPAAGGAAGARQPGAAPQPCRKTLRGGDVDLPHQHAAAAVSRRASGGAADRLADRSRRMRRSRPRRIICSTIPTPRLRARPCCRWPRCRTVSMRRRRGSIRRRRAGISKFRSRRRRARRWRSSRFRATAAAARSRPPSGCGGRGSRSTSSRPVRCMRWCR